MARSIALLVAALFTLTSGCGASRTAPGSLHYKKVVLSPESVEQMLLNGPPETGGMRSGRVVLKPGEAMHRHSTNGNEELLIFLQGQARVVLGAESASLEAGQVLYIPPGTEHEVHNEGPVELRYIFTVAPATR